MTSVPRSPATTLLLAAAALAIAAPDSSAHLSIIRQGYECAGANEPNDLSGQTFAVGDFNGDGYGDLAAGAPGEGVGALLYAGAVVIHWGSTFGVTHVGSVILTADNMLGAAQQGAQVGYALAAGDFNNDGIDDLAVAAPHATVSGNGYAGRVHILRGTPAGLTAWYALEQDDVGGAVESLDVFGFALAAGNFNGDVYDDLAVGSPGENNGSGAVVTIHGSGFGPIVTGAWFTEATLGFSSNNGDSFGRSLAAGNLVGSAHDDLAVGTPFRDVSPANDAGCVYVVLGSASGLTNTGATYYDNSTVDAAFANDNFATSLAVGDFHGGAYDGLAVGVPGRNWNGVEDAGQVIVAEGDASGLQWFFGAPIVLTSDMAGGALGVDDAFGFSLAAGYVWDPADGFEDLVVGSPGDGLGITSQAGGVQVFFGKPGGPDGSNGAWMGFHQGILGETIESGDQLGFGLAVGSFEWGPFGSIAAGAPGEDSSAGMVHIIAPWRQTYGLSCRRSVVYDCENNLVFSQKPFDRIKIASTTKIMTVLLAAERTQRPASDPLYVDINATYDVPAWVADLIPGSQVPLLTAERLTLRDLMFTCLMVSGNDAAFAIGDLLWGGGGPSSSVPLFVEEMNQRASQLGMAGTHFHNPAGLDNEPIGPDLGDHYSTPDDMAKLSRAAMNNPLFAQVAGSVQYLWTRQWKIGNTYFNVPWITWNGFLGSLQNNLASMTGIKGGWTPGAKATGCFSAFDPGTGGNAIAGHFTTPDGVANASYVPDAVNLVGLGLRECGYEFHVPPGFVLDFPTWVTEISSADSVFTGGGAEFFVVDDEQMQFNLYRLETDGNVSSLTMEIARISGINIGPGETIPYGITPFEGSDGAKVVNMGEEDALFRVTHPAIGAQTHELAPGEWLELPPYFVPMAALSWSIRNVGGVEIHLGIEETYQKLVVDSGEDTGGEPAYTAFLMRGGNPKEESYRVVTQGHDPGQGMTYYVNVHSPDVVVDAPEIDPVTGGLEVLRLLPAGPNPFSHATQIAFDLFTRADVALSIFDVSGRQVRHIEPRSLVSGRWQMTWDGTSDDGVPVAKGAYFYRVLADGKVAGRGKLVVVR